MNINKYAADKLKQLRLKKNMTQEELAEALNITQQQVARYENNLRQFKQDLLFQLAEYFNVSINDFFPPVNHLDNKEQNICEFTFGDMKVTFSKNGEITNDDYDKAMAFILEQKMKKKKDKESGV